MSNLLKVAMIDIILSLHRKGWSQRRIARELGINRETVARYLKQVTAGAKTSQCAPRLDQPRRRAKTSQCAPRLGWPRYRTECRLSHRSVRPMTMAAEPAVAGASASPGERSSSPSATWA